MNLLELRNRIRDKAIGNGLTYTEIETLFDVNLLLEQTMPCLLWRYSGETNNFDEVGTEMSLNVYLITTFPDSVRVETEAYQRDYIVTQQNALRTYFYTWLQAMPFESGDDYLEILSTEEIPIAERLGINEFLTVDFRVNISIKRDFCVDPEQITPSPSQVQVYFNDVLRYTQACNVDLELILKNQDGDLINDATFTGYEIVVTQGGGQVTININGVLWDVIDAGETENIIVRQSSGATQVGSKQGQYYRIADSVVTLEDALGVTLSTTNVKAEDSATIVAPSARVSNSDDSYDVNVVSGGDLELPDITVSNSDDSYSVTYPSVQDVELPDSQINVNGSNEGNVVSVKTIDVNITDGTNPVVPDAVSLSGNTLDIEVPSAGWERPDDWLAMPSVTSADDTFVGLHAVFDGGANFVAFTFTTDTGDYEVDWGDGNVDVVASNVQAQHQYDYSTYDTGNTTLSTRGYKQAIITVTPVSGELRTANFQKRYTTTPAQNQAYATGFLDCIVSMPFIDNTFTPRFQFGGSTVRHSYCEQFSIINFGQKSYYSALFSKCYLLQSIIIQTDTSFCRNLDSAFANCFNLKQIPLFDTSNVTSTSGTFSECKSLKTIPLFDFSSVTNMTSTFQSSGLITIPQLDFSSVTTMNQCFQLCFSLQEIPNINSSLNSSFRNCFYNCYSLQKVGDINTSSTTNFNSMFFNCMSLEEIPALNTSNATNMTNFATGANSLNRTDIVCPVSVAFSNCQLSQAELVNIFNNLVDRSSITSANINISGNWGASALTAAERQIATNKNWTITG